MSVSELQAVLIFFACFLAVFEVVERGLLSGGEFVPFLAAEGFFCGVFLGGVFGFGRGVGDVVGEIVPYIARGGEVWGDEFIEEVADEDGVLCKIVVSGFPLRYEHGLWGRNLPECHSRIFAPVPRTICQRLRSD